MHREEYDIHNPKAKGFNALIPSYGHINLSIRFIGLRISPSESLGENETAAC
jgi:hypothetical protein